MMGLWADEALSQHICVSTVGIIAYKDELI